MQRFDIWFFISNTRNIIAENTDSSIICMDVYYFQFNRQFHSFCDICFCLTTTHKSIETLQYLNLSTNVSEINTTNKKYILMLMF